MIRELICFVLVLGFGMICKAADPCPAKPNIIIIMMADDMGIEDTSVYLDVRLIPTAPPIERTLRNPNLEAFARSTILFTDGHAPASMCSTTPSSLLPARFANLYCPKH